MVSPNHSINSQYSQSTRELRRLNMPLKIIQKNSRLLLVIFAILLEKAECKVCDIDIDTISGYFESPYYPADYPNSLDCFYRFETTPGTRIKLAFDFFDVEAILNCDSDFVALYDGNSADDFLLGRFCGNEIPPLITSTTNRMLMVFHSDSSITKQGFKFRHWTQSTHFVTSNKSIITSPDPEDPYPRIGERIWNFETTPGKRIVIMFDYFLMQYKLSCPNSYIALYDGESTNDTLLGQFCGIEEPPPVISTAHKMLMIFHSDDLKEHRGYAVLLEATYATECDLDVKKVGGYGKSPNYPAEYPNSLHCFWRFESTPGTRIKLDFDSFDVEPHENCDSDFVALYDGNSADDILLGRFCGSEIPPSVTSTTNRMLMVFHSDSSNSKRGFKFRHWTQSTHFVTSNKGIVTSPKYQTVNQKMAQRIWNFETTPGKRIVIVFDYLEMQYELKCTKNYVEIYDGESTNDTLLGQFCSVDKPPPVISTAHKMLMMFHSDDFQFYILHSSRFQATYATECDIKINTTGGYGKSPNYPAEYPNSSDCFWRFESTPGTRIKLGFDSFDLEPHKNCDSDFVALYDGNSADDTLLGRFCGSEIPPSITSTTNKMLMVFHSDSSNTKQGFIFRHWTQSTHFVTSIKGIVKSPNYPNDYPRSAERIWIFETTPRNKIVVMFDDLSMRSDKQCVSDYVAFYDGETANGTLLGRFCGKRKRNKPHIISTTHKMLMIFHSDDSNDDYSENRYKGFKATYAIDLNSKEYNIASEEVEKILVELLLKTRQDTRTSAINKWGDAIPLTTVALFLHDPQFFAVGNKTGEEIVYELTLQLISKLVMEKRISTNDLAFFINAMTVTCINPRNFFGFNMVAELRKRLDNENSTNPFFLLTLCNAGENITMKDVHNLQWLFSAHLQPAWTEKQAMTVMALKCISRQSHRDLDTTLTEMVSVLKKKQQKNGTVENVKNTALVIQALIATESHETDFNLNRAMKFILFDMKDKQAGIEEIYSVLPIVRWKSLLDINSNHCENFIKTGPVDVQENVIN